MEREGPLVYLWKKKYPIFQSFNLNWEVTHFYQIQDINMKCKT